MGQKTAVRPAEIREFHDQQAETRAGLTLDPSFTIQRGARRSRWAMSTISRVCFIDGAGTCHLSLELNRSRQQQQRTRAQLGL